MTKEFNVGDYIMLCVETEEEICAYASWSSAFEEYDSFKPYKGQWHFVSFPDLGRRYIVLAKEKHSAENTIIYLIEDIETEQVYIVGPETFMLCLTPDLICSELIMKEVK